MIQEIGLGGGCHWCTEAIFQGLKGVSEVRQGWISSREFPSFSEAILLCFDPSVISLSDLLRIHLQTHSATSAHQMRTKYRSAVYVFSKAQQAIVEKHLLELQTEYPEKLITRPLRFQDFKLNTETYLDYYRRDPEKPFCKNVIRPKLVKLKENFSEQLDPDKIPLTRSGESRVKFL
ncbi:peptide-methionine (S)-S-oxide reductase [Muriicola soli]|uniref:peptide-methionine (S)-S-oxide reductase n=1 Tax=Muriicola soli TaxID=2507538 RepID=A0A411EC53_9FLAO|nr:peptide-methionine (S)-S-oxide reductase [Muriicola soli]QBA65312.1 peptide methionine sulfoxide reductase [Muriicola soli]